MSELIAENFSQYELICGQKLYYGREHGGSEFKFI